MIIVSQFFPVYGANHMIIILLQVEGIKHLETSIFSIPDLGRSIYTDVIIRYHY